MGFGVCGSGFRLVDLGFMLWAYGLWCRFSGSRNTIQISGLKGIGDRAFSWWLEENAEIGHRECQRETSRLYYSHSFQRSLLVSNRFKRLTGAELWNVPQKGHLLGRLGYMGNINPIPQNPVSSSSI